MALTNPGAMQTLRWSSLIASCARYRLFGDAVFWGAASVNDSSDLCCRSRHTEPVLLMQSVIRAGIFVIRDLSHRAGRLAVTVSNVGAIAWRATTSCAATPSR